MKHYKKIGFILTICLIFSAFLGSLYYQKDGLTFNVSNAYAADEEKKEKDPEKKDGEDVEEKPCPECPECPDPAKVVLRGLEEKKTMIEKQHNSFKQEKKELEIFEEQIDEKLENLNALKKQIEESMVLLDKKKTQQELDREAAYEAKIGRLVKMYAGMKPKNAAQIVDKMNLEVAQEIFLRMREASASLILAFVDSEKAAKISERLAFKKK
ncbi:MAG: hypothetical protein GY699_20030 [Desulfobacteraceae bacterium]|nr:hypothetical protein [Desulfobacteraceae bacterium]